jgi:hypothetical protein
MKFERRSHLRRQKFARIRTGRARARRRFSRVSISGRSSGRVEFAVFAARLQRENEASRRRRTRPARIQRFAERTRENRRNGFVVFQAFGQRRLFRRREEAQRDFADGGFEPKLAFSTKPIPVSTSTRCASSPKASTNCARRKTRSFWSRIISGF